MITGFLLGASIMLIGVIVGHLTGKSWLDKQFARVAAKPAPLTPTKGYQPTTGLVHPSPPQSVSASVPFATAQDTKETSV